MENIQWKCIDAISIIPCLNVVDDNFHFFLEDAWNIVFENGIGHPRDFDITDVEEKGFGEYGNLLLWVLSFLDLYNEFNHRKEGIIHVSPNYLILIEGYLEGIECIEEYFGRNRKLIGNQCDEGGAQDKFELIVCDDVRVRKAYIKERISFYINRRLGKFTDAYKKDMLISIFTCVNWLNRYAKLTPTVFTELIKLEDDQFTEEIKSISRNSFNEVANAALPYDLSLSLSLECFKDIPYIMIDKKIIYFNIREFEFEGEMKNESIYYGLIRDYEFRKIERIHGFSRWLNKWFD